MTSRRLTSGAAPSQGQWRRPGPPNKIWVSGIRGRQRQSGQMMIDRVDERGRGGFAFVAGARSWELVVAVTSHALSGSSGLHALRTDARIWLLLPS